MASGAGEKGGVASGTGEEGGVASGAGAGPAGLLSWVSTVACSWAIGIASLGLSRFS